MTFIYSFLQKRKMHESQHGIFMVVMAYVLSVLMLVLGSDMFYDIRSSAAGIHQGDEETKEIVTEDAGEVQNAGDTYLMMRSELINPYNLSVNSKADDASANALTLTGEDTVWFLGNEMSNEAFGSLMGQLDGIVPEKSTIKAKTTAKKEKKIETFSVKESSSEALSSLTDKEVEMLERIVEAEASGEDLIGKILIVNVIMNRIADDDFPDTVKDVIFQEVDGDYQFSPVANNRYWSVKISKETEKAVKKALEGEDYSEGALYFMARKRTASSNAAWFDNHLMWLFKHGGHEFYKNK